MFAHLIVIAWWVLLIALAGVGLFCLIEAADRRRRWRRLYRGDGS